MVLGSACCKDAWVTRDMRGISAVSAQHLFPTQPVVAGAGAVSIKTHLTLTSHPSHTCSLLQVSCALLPCVLTAAYYTPPHGDDQAPSPQAVSLTDVCYKPFGTTCALQSVLQYWHMDADVYRKEQVSEGGVTRTEGGASASLHLSAAAMGTT
jgi:hypothetical protein